MYFQFHFEGLKVSYFSVSFPKWCCKSEGLKVSYFSVSFPKWCCKSGFFQRVSFRVGPKFVTLQC